MMGSGFLHQARGPRPAHVEAEMKAIADELEVLVNRMDDELRDAGTVSTETAERLNELRRRFEQLFGTPKDRHAG
jgi:hypothetical protein